MVVYIIKTRLIFSCAGCQFLSRVKLISIQSFPFSRLVAQSVSNLPYYLPIVDIGKTDLCLSQGY